MPHFTQNERTTKDQVIHLYTGISKQELDGKLHQLLIATGYILKEGVPGNGTYTKGNRILRLLFGAFVKYFKFHLISTEDQQNGVRVDVRKATSGMSGGLIGMNQVKKELANLGRMLATI